MARKIPRPHHLGVLGIGLLALAGIATIAQSFSNGGGFMLAPADSTTALAGNTRFALDLYSKLRATPGNLFFSPFSLSSALALTSAGAKGETARQMAETLHLPPGDNPHSGFRALSQAVNGGKDEPTRPYQLLTANALWARKDDHFLPDFLKIARDDYDAGLNEVDFRGDTEGARTAINTWVEEKTHDKIKDLIPKSAISPATALVLSNAIYFKADWRDAFPEGLTNKNDVFTTADGRQVPVVMMRQPSPKMYGYYDSGPFHLVELPYVGGTLAMDVLLPKAADGLTALEATLSESKLTEWTGKLVPVSVQVELPKFRLEQSYEMSKPLIDLGMVFAFDGSKADFSGMTGRRGLAISAVVHKAFVDVSEKGTEAAAATGVMMARTSMANRPKIINFRADHPFLFLIRDLKSGSILFLGRMIEPNARGS